MPPNTQLANRVGVGVFLEGDNRLLPHLRDVQAELRAILNLSRQLPANLTRALQPRAPRASRAGGERTVAQQVQEDTRQLGLFDQQMTRVVANVERRAEGAGRRIGDAFKRATRSMQEQMADMTDAAFRTFAANRPLDDPQILAEYERRWGQAGGRSAQSRPDARSTADVLGKTQADLDAQAWFAHQSEHAKKGARTPELEAAIARHEARMRATNKLPEDRPLTFGPSPITPLDPNEVAEAEAFKDKAKRDAIRAQQRRAAREEQEFELASTRTVGEQLRRQEGEIDAAAQERVRKRELNERINARAAEINERRRVTERANFDREMAHAREMAQRTERAERSASRAGYRTPDEQREFESRNLREYEARRRAFRRNVERRRRQREEERYQEAVAADREAQARRDDLRRYAARDPNLGTADPEVLRMRVDSLQAARRAGRPRGDAEQTARDIAARELRATRVRNEEAERAERERRRRLDSEREAEAVRRERAMAAEQQREGVRREREGLRRRVRGSEYGPTRADVLDTNVVGRNLDDISRRAAEVQRQLSTLRFRGSREIREDARAASISLTQLEARAETLRMELARPANMRRTKQAIEADLEAIQREMGQTIRLTAQLRNSFAQMGGGGGPGGPGGGPFDRGRGGPFGSADMLLRIGRNILLYSAVAGTVYALKDYVAQSIEAARASNDMVRALESEAIAAQTSSDANMQLAESMRTLGLGRTQARQTVTEALRFAEDEPYLAEDLARAVADIGASRGARAAETPELLEQFRRRESKFYKRYTGSTVEEIYRSYATRAVDAGAVDYSDDPNDFSGRFMTRNRAIERYVAHMSDAEKATAVYQAVLKRGEIFEGEASRRQEDLAGRIDRVSNRWKEAQENVGLMILQIRPLVYVIESLASALDTVDFSKFRGTGPQGLLAPEDIDAFVRSRQESWADSFSDYFEGLGRRAGPFGRLITGSGEGGALSTERVWGHVTNRLESAATALFRVADTLTAGYLESFIPGGGGYVDPEERVREEAEQEFWRERNRRVQQMAREGSLRFRRAGEEEGLSREELLIRRAEGQDISAYSEMYVESEQQRVARQVRARQEGEEERMRRHREEAESREQELQHRKAREEAQEQLNRLSGVLAKLRDTAAGSFRVIEERGSVITGPNNPYVKILADQQTLNERMRLAWAGLGEEMVKEQTIIEGLRIEGARLGQQWNTLAEVQQRLGLAESERVERLLSPELTRMEQGFVGLATSMADASENIPRLQRFLISVLGTGSLGQNYLFDQSRFLRAQLENLEGVRSLGIGLDPQGRRGVNRVVDERAMALLQGFDERQLRRMAARDPFIREAIRTVGQSQLEEYTASVEDARSQILIQQAERERREGQLREIESLAERQRVGVYQRAIQEGRGTEFGGRFVGTLRPEEEGLLRRIEESRSQALIRATEGVSPRDLGAEEFELRNEALRNLAQQAQSAEEEARAAVQEGLALQNQILAAVSSIREALYAGNMSLLVRVENDTQARTDATHLKEVGRGLDAPLRETDVRPYTGAFGTYGRGGRRN